MTSKSIDFGSEKDITTLVSMSQAISGIGLVSQRAVLFAVRSLCGEADRIKAANNGKDDYKVNPMELNAYQHIRALTVSKNIKLCFRKQLVNFFKAYTPLTFNADNSGKNQKITVTSIRECRGKLEKLFKDNDFPVVIMEDSERIKEEKTPQITTAESHIDKLIKKFKKDEDNHLIENSQRFATTLQFVRENPVLIKGVMENAWLLESILNNPALIEELKTKAKAK